MRIISWKLGVRPNNKPLKPRIVAQCWRKKVILRSSRLYVSALRGMHFKRQGCPKVWSRPVACIHESAPLSKQKQHEYG